MPNKTSSRPERSTRKRVNYDETDADNLNTAPTLKKPKTEDDDYVPPAGFKIKEIKQEPMSDGDGEEDEPPVAGAVVADAAVEDIDAREVVRGVANEEPMDLDNNEEHAAQRQRGHDGRIGQRLIGREAAKSPAARQTHKLGTRAQAAEVEREDREAYAKLSREELIQKLINKDFELTYLRIWNVMRRDKIKELKAKIERD